MADGAPLSAERELWQPILSALDRLFHIAGFHRVWEYLNKGTHDATNLDDFEEPVVRQLVEALEALELALEQRPVPAPPPTEIAGK